MGNGRAAASGVMTYTAFDAADFEQRVDVLKLTTYPGVSAATKPDDAVELFEIVSPTYIIYALHRRTRIRWKRKERPGP